jgi:hypothetical protein
MLLIWLAMEAGRIYHGGTFTWEMLFVPLMGGIIIFASAHPKGAPEARE